jgi:hypothetical protein
MGYHFNDGKLIGPLWQSLGFREIPRAEFLARAGKAARARQERPMAGRGRPSHRVAMAARQALTPESNRHGWCAPAVLALDRIELKD